MSWPEALLPLAVLGPLGVAAALLAGEHALPRRAADIVAIVVALADMLLCAFLAHAAQGGPVLHWFGGWTPDASGRSGVVLGIAFSADPASAGIASFCGLLFMAVFVFAWGYFDEVRAHFHVLMLLFLAGMVGFCLTRDLFDLFVWFELMSVAAYALTAYPLGPSSLEGAFNFTVVNTIASYGLLTSVALLYARTGALDYEATGHAIGSAGADPVVIAAFCLIVLALLTKGACVPFHFWLADAHAVAPSPVSVIFSGAMVSLALFGLAKLAAIMFGSNADVTALLHEGLTAIGAVTALVGALTAWAQRHLKRLLAFSTIAHLGVMLTGLSADNGIGRAGLLLYMVGHGLVKGSLFMVAGMLLALQASVDEIDLYGRARRLWPVGVAMGAAGLLLGGLPVGLLHGGTHLIEAATEGRPLIHLAQLVAAALTGAAVLRAALRIFAGASGAPGPEREGASEREHEKNDRPLAVMLAPCAALVGMALLLAPWGEYLAKIGAAGLQGQPVAAHAPETWFGLLAPIGLTLTLLSVSLVRRRPTTTSGRRLLVLETTPFNVLQRLHSGLVVDYVSWLALGLAALAVAAR